MEITAAQVKELRENRGFSVNEVMRTVSTAVNKKNKEQTPQVEGDIDRQFLGTSDSRQKFSIPILKVEKVGSDTMLTIEAGKIVGALQGGLVGIYKDTAVEFTGETDRIAVGKIMDSFNLLLKFWSPARKFHRSQRLFSQRLFLQIKNEKSELTQPALIRDH